MAELHLSFATPAGQPLTDPAPLPPLCRLLRQSVCREPEALCAFAATPLRRRLADGDGPVFAECPYLGLPVAAVPLHVDGIWLAAAVCGRSAPLSALDEEWLRCKARGLRVRPDDLRAALAEAPAIGEDRLRAFALHVSAMLHALSELAEARLAEARARQALEVTNHRLGALWAIAASIIRSRSLEEALGEALQTILDLLQLESGAVFLRDNGGPGALLAAHRGVRPEYAALAADVLASGGTPAGHLLHGTLGPWVVTDVDSEPDLPQGALRQLQIGAFVAAPLRAGEDTLGALMVHTPGPRAFRDDEVALIAAAAEQVGIGLQGQRLLATEKRRAEELAALQRFSDRILHTMQEGIFIINTNGEVSYATPRLAEMAGYEVDELIGKGWSTFTQPADRDRLQQSLDLFVGGHSARLEVELVRKDGAIRHLTLGVVPLFEEDAFAGLLGVAADLTEEVDLRRRLQQAEKLSAIGELVSGVAHELNNPLTVIRGYAQLLSGRQAEAAGRELRAIMENAERAARIVQGLLTFARERPPVQETVDLNAVLESVLDMRERQLLTSGVRVRRDLAQDLPMVRGDPYQLQQVFHNIVTNAEQAIAEKGGGGEIHIRTSALADAQVLAAIRDDGPGIPAAVADRIFDPFFTTKADRQGTGLGLSICYGIVNAHNGRIWADSVEGQGATFFVALPAQPSEAEPAPGRAGAEGAGASAGEGRVLVLEDEVEIADLVARCLERLGCCVATAHDGQAALRLLEQDDFDVILTDLKMPGMSGREFYTCLTGPRAHLAERVIFVTGDMVSQETERFLGQCGRPHLAKPFSLDEMERLVMTALRRRGPAGPVGEG